jgi:hypothetical protein
MEEWQKFLLLSRCLTIQDLFIFFFNAMARTRYVSDPLLWSCGGTDPQILDVIHEAIALTASQGGTQQ